MCDGMVYSWKYALALLQKNIVIDLQEPPSSSSCVSPIWKAGGQKQHEPLINLRGKDQCHFSTASSVLH